MAKTEYRNWLSRLLLKRYFERQALQPQKVSLLGKSLGLVQRFMKIDVAAIAIDRPIFITGNARSGTTMLSNILCSHPSTAYFTNAMNEFPRSFCAAEKLRRFFRLDVKGERYQQDSVLVSAGTPSEGNDLWHHVLQPAPDDVLVMKVFKREDLSNEQIEKINTMIRQVIWCFGGGSRRFINKAPTYRLLVSLMNELYPDCRIIHIVRDPRQCANSVVKMVHKAAEHRQKFNRDEVDALLKPKSGEPAIREAALYWNSMIEFIRTFKTKTKNLIEVRYEDILVQPRLEIERIREFCELEPVTDTRSAYWKEIDQVGNLSHVNDYGNYELIESICAKNMDIYGYRR